MAAKFSKIIFPTVLLVASLGFLVNDAGAAIMIADDLICTAPIADVRAFGAVGDAYTDNQAAFQNANNFLINGGTILVPQGVFVLGSSVTLSDSVNIVGVGNSSEIRCRSMSTGYAALVAAGSNNRVRNLKFTGEAEDVDGSTAIDISGSNISVDNCVIEGFQNGLVVSGSDIKIERNWISGSKKNGILAGNLIGGEIGGNTVQLCGSSGILGASDGPAPGLEDVVFVGNKCDTNNGDGIELQSGMAGIIISDNVCQANLRSGIYLEKPEGAVPAGNAEINSNSCFGNLLSGIVIDGLDGFSAGSNRIYKNGGSGIECIGAANGAIGGNFISENALHGIKLSGRSAQLSSRVMVTGNACFDNGPGSGTYGIYVDRFTEKATITGNIALNHSQSNQAYGVKVNSSGTAEINVARNCCPDTLAADGFGVIVRGAANYGADNEVSFGGIKAITDSGISPQIWGAAMFTVSNSAPTEISSFTGGSNGQIIGIVFQDNNSTVKHNDTSIKLSGEVDWSPGSGDSISLIYDGLRWLELGRSSK